MSKEVIGNILGWTATLVLLGTLLAQIHREIKSGKVDEISPLLFVGQCAASIGFLLYSTLVGNLVFIVSNAMILAVALLGVWVRHHVKTKSAAAGSAR
jgi:MtN3 and saliva related transmembrane protein